SGSLYEGLEDHPALVQERILDIAIQFARGLYYAHESRDDSGNPQKLIHRDVKPGNVLLSKSGEVKVSDFGLTKAVTQPLQGNPADGTKGSCFKGTPAYCSAEQMDEKPLTLQTDLYSWAVSVMEMYRGSHPWANGVVAGIGCRKYFEEAKVPVSSAMADLLERCLAARPDDRPRDFGLVIAELRAIYRMVTGKDYPREASQSAADTADSLNNRALSMLDLGKPEEAEKFWERALQSSPGHPASVFNQSIHLWRAGKILDREARLRIAVVDPNAAEALAEEGIVATKIFDFSDLFTKYYSATLLSKLDGGLYCLIGDTSGFISCYDVSTQKNLWSKSFHKSSFNMNFCSGGGVLGLVKSPDPRCFYSFGGDATVNRIDLISGDVLSRFNTDSVYHPPKYVSYKVVSLSASFNGALVACLTNCDADENSLLLLNAATLDLIQSFRDPSGELKSICFLPNEQWIASDGAQALSIWEQTAGCIQSFSVSTEVKGLKVCSDGTVLVCNDAGGLMRIDGAGTIKSTLALAHGVFRGLQVSDSGFGIASFDESIVFDAHMPGHARIIPGGGPAISVADRYAATTSGVFSLSVQQNADYLLCGVETYQETDSQNKRFVNALRAGYAALERYDFQQAQEQLRLARQIRLEDIACIQLNDAIGRYGKRIGIQTIYQINAKMEHPYPVIGVQINHAKTAVVTLCQEGLIRLYSKEGVLQNSWKIENDALNLAYFSAEDRAVIAIGTDGSYWIDLLTNQIQPLMGQLRYLTQNARLDILSGKEKGSLDILDREKSTILASIEDCGGIILKAVEQEDKLYLFTTDRVGALDTFLHSILVISLQTGKAEANYHFSTRAVDQAPVTFQVHSLNCVDSEGRNFGGKIYKNRPTVISTRESHTNRGKRYPTNRSLTAAFEKSDSAITDTAFSSDGNFLFVANAEGVITVFDVAGQKKAFSLRAHTEKIYCIALEE
ncbi:MAG: protein kinase, partial [Christensenella sp.]|nr:protein kinase [Christensenella sp.]